MSRLPLRLLLVAFTFALSACASKRIDHDFAGFSKDYADNMNWQMLLNLARLDQGHPAYFMAIGEIRMARSQTISANTSGSSNRTNATQTAASAVNTITDVLSASVGGSASNVVNPSFVFIPINSEEAARQLLSPISIDVFNMLYQQGWPVDQLMRVLVERIEVDLPASDGLPAQHLVLVNSPTRAEPASFARFLRVCEIVRDLQKSGGLALVAEERFTPLSSTETPSISTREILDAADKNRTWQKRPGSNTYQLGTARQVYRFQANQELVETTIATFSADKTPDYQSSLDNLRAVLSATVATAAESNDRRPAGPRSTIILRSFRNVLEAVASEQQAFAELSADPAFASVVPKRQLRPVLQLTWEKSSTPALASPAVKLSYAGRDYQITDPSGPATSLDSRWNRDIFRLLVNLSSQVTVDIAKFQRQVIELN